MTDPSTLERAVEAATTFLFVPGDKPERFAKALASGADAIIVDLEDAVAPDRKEFARRAVTEALDDLRGCIIRINTAGGKPEARDLDVIAGGLVAVMVPKAEPGGMWADLTSTLGPHTPLLALIETSRGVLSATEVAQVPAVRRIALGTFDLAAELGIDPADRQALDAARQHLVLASAAAGLPGPIDGVTATIGDSAVVGGDAAHARRLGMSAKLCVHPQQISPTRAALLPHAELVAWARRVTHAAAASGTGVVTVDGAMVDRPVVLRAERILRAVEGASPAQESG